AGDLPPAGQMAFTMGRYFDNADVGEAVAHELAAQMMGGRQPALADLPIRCMVGDPTDPGRRSMPVAITTLTIRYDSRRHEARFLTHWRDPALVATNGDMYTVVPVGMFQPAGTTRGDGTGDFDLWRGMAREYSEELLGNAEHRDVNYQAWAFFTTLERLRAEGSCRPYCCGIGVDPLTLATDLLAVTVFEAAAFDELFADLVEDNDEGHTVVRGSDGTFGTLFCAEEIHRLVAVEHVQSAGAAVLEAAWRMRSALVGV
ncbi:MAG: XRE family transcriptional regulator, partial [Micromonosporaceae bacterium]|nr:XRE family transcriptional regulator [Micromonosporaceae bacterium]